MVKELTKMPLYCQSCACAIGVPRPASSISFLATSCQIGYREKHTRPTKYDYPNNGILFQPRLYEGLGASTIAYGWMNCSGGSLLSMDWYTGSPIAGLYSESRWAELSHTYRDVLFHLPGLEHGFAIPDSSLKYAHCDRCGASSPV